MTGSARNVVIRRILKAAIHVVPAIVRFVHLAVEYENVTDFRFWHIGDSTGEICHVRG